MVYFLKFSWNFLLHACLQNIACSVFWHFAYAVMSLEINAGKNSPGRLPTPLSFSLSCVCVWVYDCLSVSLKCNVVAAVTSVPVATCAASKTSSVVRFFHALDLKIAPLHPRQNNSLAWVPGCDVSSLGESISGGCVVARFLSLARERNAPLSGSRVQPGSRVVVRVAPLGSIAWCEIGLTGRPRPSWWIILTQQRGRTWTCFFTHFTW